MFERALADDALRETYHGLLGVVMLLTRDFERLSHHDEIYNGLLKLIEKNPIAFQVFTYQTRVYWTINERNGFREIGLDQILESIELNGQPSKEVLQIKSATKIDEDTLLHTASDSLSKILEKNPEFVSTTPCS